MTHTEESLMALVNEAINSAEAAMADHCSPMGSPSFRYSNAQAREDEAALRIAIREVLAERYSCAGQIAEAVDQRDRQARRAEKAEAEVERLKQELVGQAFKFGLAEDGLRKDAARYRRLQILGVAPGGSRYLDNGTVLRFTNLDKYVDNDIAAHPSRGESTIEQAKRMTPTAAQTELAKDAVAFLDLNGMHLAAGVVRRYVLKEE